MATWQLVLIGIGGGVAAELGTWFAIRKELHQGLPDWSKSLSYWVVTGFMVLAGGGLVWLYVLTSGPMNPVLALNVGASAPLILQKLAQQTPEVGPGSAD